MNNYKLVMGDYSKDGHKRWEFIHFTSNITDKEIKVAYNKAIKRCGVSLHGQECTAKGKCKNLPNPICCNYQDGAISNENMGKLLKQGVNMEEMDTTFDLDSGEDYPTSPEDLARVFLELVRSVRPDFQYKIKEDEAPCINGWTEDFSHGFGYGLYQ